MSRKRILFIPADSLPLGLTRSSWLAKTLAGHHEVYSLAWHDPRAALWSNDRGRLIAAPNAFIRSLWTRIEVKPDPGTWLPKPMRVPLMLTTGLHRLVGQTLARRLARGFNRIVLTRVARRLAPDVLFFADGFYHFPPPSVCAARIYADVQDDFDDDGSARDMRETAYVRSCYARCQKVYAVSPGAAERLSRLYGITAFSWLPNGADFSSFRSISATQALEARARLGLVGRWVISFIGGPVWYDPVFFQALAKRLECQMPEATFLVVGNLTNVPASNVVHLGFVEPRRIAELFVLSDMGIQFRSSLGSQFLKHSIPLKIIQFSAARKPFLSPPVRWLEENQFPNVKIAAPEVEVWLESIRRMKRFTWTQECEKAWAGYDWGEIGNGLAREM